MDVSDLTDGDHVIFFDSLCVLCNYFIKWVVAQDPGRKFFFAPLDSDYATKIRAQFPEAVGVDSVLYFDGKKVYAKGVAVRKVIQELSTFKLLKIALNFTPAFLLSFGYDLIAANRYKIFGRYDVCPPLPPEWRGRFKT